VAKNLGDQVLDWALRWRVRFSTCFLKRWSNHWLSAIGQIVPEARLQGTTAHGSTVHAGGRDNDGGSALNVWILTIGLFFVNLGHAGTDIAANSQAVVI
jgi:hypothetical protein